MSCSSKLLKLMTFEYRTLMLCMHQSSFRHFNSHFVFQSYGDDVIIFDVSSVLFIYQHSFDTVSTQFRHSGI